MKNPEPRRLSTLVESISDAKILGDTGTMITGIADDSRRVSPGNLFCALQGTRVDGEIFIQEAIDRGAAAIVTRSPRSYQIPVITVNNPRKALGLLASAWFNNPSREMNVIATTGTDGKTSVSYIISRMLSHAGKRCGYIGTLGSFGDEQTYTSSHTTPPPLILQRILSEMINDSTHTVSMEASSHGLKQDRLSGITLKTAVFTTFGRDHLDYHESSEEYLKSKLSLFRYLENRGTAVVNARFPEIVGSARNVVKNMIIFSTTRENVDVTVEHVEISGGLRHAFLKHGSRRFSIAIKLHGEFQIENVAAATAAGITMGLDYDQICRGIESVEYIPGRFEPVYAEGALRAIVDYAHTPEALRNALKSARSITSGRLIVVFGCGGDRDTGKRPLMGRIAEQLADIAIVTSDNPRSEDPESIITEIMTGIRSPSNIIRITDRLEAIEEAIRRSSEKDIILVAGKGHEKTQTIGGHVYPFDDCAVVRKLLKAEEIVT